MELTFLFQVPSIEEVKPTFSRKLRVYSADVAGDGNPVCYAMAEGYVPDSRYWTDTNTDVYVSDILTTSQDGVIVLPDGVERNGEESEGYFTFNSRSPYAGERAYWKGYALKIMGKYADDKYKTDADNIIQRSVPFCIIAKNEELLNNTFTIKHDYTEISEPINFDSFKTKITRSDLHGISVENSTDKLEFYGNAYDVIKEAYDTDIDTEIKLKVIAGDTTIYEEVVDLSTCEFQESDYKSVSATLAEIGDKTTFNNRVKTEVDINGSKTIDGIEIEPAIFTDVNIESRHLPYTNITKQAYDTVITKGGGYQTNPDVGVEILSDYNCVQIPIGETVVNEFGSITDNTLAYTTDDSDNIPGVYTPNESHTETYGSNTTAKVNIKLNASLERVGSSWSLSTEEQQSQKIWWNLAIRCGNGSEYHGVPHSATLAEITHEGDILDIPCDIECEVPADKSTTYYVNFTIELGKYSRLYFYSHITVKKGSVFKMVMYDNLPQETTPVKMVTIHDALNVIARTISEDKLTIKSDWYGLPASQFNPTTASGNGGYRSLTNGYKIRDLFTDEEEERNMTTSFSDMIDSLQAIDCIGWGFVDEGGKTYVRVEPWLWFYKDDVVLSFTNVKEIKKTIDTDTIFTKFSIGYNKYESSDAFNSIDSIHGERTFASKIKAVSNEIEAMCDFIADNYAIELTRRARKNNKATEECSYDENIFIFELDSTGKVRHPLVSATGIEKKKEWINLGISPRRCAKRWVDYLFRANSNSPLMFSTGTINYKAVLSFFDYGDISIEDGGGISAIPIAPKIAEDSDIAYTQCKLKAETIEFTYPLSVSEYQKVKANPYGLISVDGVLGWIKEFSYSFTDGEATFKLISKAD